MQMNSVFISVLDWVNGPILTAINIEILKHFTFFIYVGLKFFCRISRITV